MFLSAAPKAAHPPLYVAQAVVAHVRALHDFGLEVLTWLADACELGYTVGS
jgi:hypothetical protein